MSRIVSIDDLKRSCTKLDTYILAAIEVFEEEYPDFMVGDIVISRYDSFLSTDPNITPTQYVKCQIKMRRSGYEYYE